MDLNQSNQFLIKKLEQNEPFLITRLGIGAETIVTYFTANNRHIEESLHRTLQHNAGILCENNEQIRE